MTTSFSSLPIVDLSILSHPEPSPPHLLALSNNLYHAFATTGFAYLVNPPLTPTHEDVFGLASDFFGLDVDEKMSLAKRTFVKANHNTYRGYFPPQPNQQDNLKEGFEVGPASDSARLNLGRHQKFNLTETNVWPDNPSFRQTRLGIEALHKEMQGLASSLLSLLAVSLGKPPDYFASYLADSLSTLRLLHYPHQPSSSSSDEVKLCCTPHTDSGILTLLYQDPTGGLEVLNAAGDWISAPYIPGSIVVNIGDLLAQVSGGRFVATMHRVRTNAAAAGQEDGMGRFSVPFFFEPGEACIVKNVDSGEGMLYGEYVRKKMGMWVEYQEEEPGMMDGGVAPAIAVEA